MANSRLRQIQNQLDQYDPSADPSRVDGHVIIEARWESIGYDGKSVHTSLSAKSQKFTVGAVNATVLISMNITDLTSGGSIPADKAVLVATVTASGTPPNSKATTTNTHSNFFTATPLGKAKLVDPGFTLRQGRGSFILTAEKGVSAFTWLGLDPKHAWWGGGW